MSLKNENARADVRCGQGHASCSKTTVFGALYANMRRLGREESGAAFVVTLGVFLLMWVVCSGVYAVGETVRRKIQIQNASDAAAYSAAVVQADFLSRIATINRAMSWTYVQMTRRQMDCITKEWMKKTLERIEGDRNKMKSIHRSWCMGICDGSHPSSSPGINTFWCGLDGIDGIFSINSDLPIMIPNIVEKIAKIYVTALLPAESLKNGKSGASIGGLVGMPLKEQILLDKLNILTMNAMLLKLQIEYSGKVEDTVREVVKANLPETELGEFTYACQKESPLTWFNTLNNTKLDERRFLMFAGDYAGKSANQVFNDGVSSGKKAGGVNHWFVRVKASGQGVPETSSTQGSTGICRGYRKLDKQKKPEATANCKNKDIDNDSDPRESTALVSEWHHNAWGYICFPTLTSWVHIPLPFALMLEGGKCKWYSSSSTISSRKNCTWPIILDLGQVLPGGGRVYGDDPELVSQLGWSSVYQGQRCNPVILNSLPMGFFGKGGAILVGVARKAENPWNKILGKAADGVFKAFDPAPTMTHLWAVSAARAGYKEWSDNTSNYQLGYTSDDGNNFQYCWNLRQTDWDAFFLPVKHAWDYCSGTRGQTPVFVPAGGGNPLNHMMARASWTPLKGGSHPAWGNPSAPKGMNGGTLNWSGLNDSMQH